MVRGGAARSTGPLFLASGGDTFDCDRKVDADCSISPWELWVPAEELTDFNCHIVGQIRVVAEFPGEAAGL